MEKRAYIISIVLHLALLTTFFVFSVQAAEEYPTRPVEIICPVDPGGLTDLTMRAVVAVAQQYLGQPMVPIHRSGAGGAIGANFVAKSKPDGYTILISGASVILLKPLTEDLPYKTEDFIPIGRIALTPAIVVVPVSSRWKTLKEFVEDARKNPKKFRYSAGGFGHPEHLYLSLFSRAAGIELIMIPAGGGGSALTMLLGEHVEISTFFPSVIMPHIAAGKVRPLAVVSDERVGLPGVEGVPTLKELGYPVTGYFFNGIFAPKGVPQIVAQKLRTTLKQICEDKTFKGLMAQMNEDVRYLSGEDFEIYLARQKVVLGDLLKSLK